MVYTNTSRQISVIFFAYIVVTDNSDDEIGNDNTLVGTPLPASYVVW